MSTLSMLQSIEDKIEELSTLSVLKAVFIALFGFFLYRKLISLLEKVLEKSEALAPYKNEILKAAKGLLLFSLIVAVIAELGINISSLLMILALAILVLLYAAQDFFENLVSGIVIASVGAFKRGDFITAGDKTGTVCDMRLNCTKLETLSGEIITMPNKSISSAAVTNYSSLGRRCIITPICASYDDDPEKVISVCENMLRSTEGVLSDYPVKVVLTEYGDSNIIYNTYFWVKSSDYMPLKFEVNRKLYQALKDAGIQISYPRVRIEMPEGSKTEEA